MNNKPLIDALIATLQPASIGDPTVLTDAQSLVHYGQDWTRFHDPAPLAVVLPTTIAEVVALVQFARSHNIPLVPSGGRTGLSGGAVACAGEIVVAFDRMNQLGEINTIDRTVVCGPGVITAQLQQLASEQGLFYPVDFAASGSSQIGGNISTNAGGIKVIRYGMTRQWVAGLKVVTGAGELLTLNRGLFKNNAGYDLQQLFIGAEGTLGFIVEATLRLTRPAQNLAVLLLAVESMAGIMAIAQLFREQIDLTAFEFFSEQALTLVMAHTGLPRPMAESAPFYVLLEFEMASAAHEEQVMTLFEQCLEQGLVSDGVISQSLQQLQNLWRYREDISETITPWTPYKNDIAVLPSQVPACLADIDAVVQREYPNFQIIWFGHIGDGNLHLNILKPDTMARPQFLQHCQHVSRWVFEIVQKYGGSVSAEHGIGLLKKQALAYSRSPEEIRLMEEIKKVFDPDAIMNPGKIFDVQDKL